MPFADDFRHGRDSDDGATLAVSVPLPRRMPPRTPQWTETPTQTLTLAPVETGAATPDAATERLEPRPGRRQEP
ncbi:MAG: hypothetical protein ABSG07_06470 [Terriglobales bacterium]